MSKGYLIAHLKEHDKEGMEKFKQMSGPTIGEHGGKVLVREPSPDVREGENLGAVVLIEFEALMLLVNSMSQKNIKRLKRLEN